MLGRLKKTVTSVIGNPVCREYEFTVQTGTCGPGGLWKIYDGRKKSTGQVLYTYRNWLTCFEPFSGNMS
jgi:hypothetical protein